MRSHTLPLAGRTGGDLTLSAEEALELASKGFRFAVYRPGAELCRLSLPIETVVDFEAGTLTIRQHEAKH
jgi:hypothetical protein